MKTNMDSMVIDKKVWTEDSIRTLIETNDKMVVRSLLKLYECQTEEEKVNSESIEHNGKGFNSIDADFMSNVAKQYIECNFITKRQIFYVRNKLYKYIKQLTRIANA